MRDVRQQSVQRSNAAAERLRQSYKQSDIVATYVKTLHVSVALRHTQCPSTRVPQPMSVAFVQVQAWRCLASLQTILDSLLQFLCWALRVLQDDSPHQQRHCNHGCLLPRLEHQEPAANQTREGQPRKAIPQQQQKQQHLRARHLPKYLWQPIHLCIFHANLHRCLHFSLLLEKENGVRSVSLQS